MDAKQRSRLMNRLRRGLIALALGASTSMAGCKLMECPSCFSSHQSKKTDTAAHPAAPPSSPGMPKEAGTYWRNCLVMAPDPIRGGEPTPGLAGRLYLFGNDGNLALFDGAVTVNLYNDRPLGGGQPVMIEQWNIPAETLKTMARKDTIGWGYTLFLPTARCTPDVTQVHLLVQFKPDAAEIPLYAPASSMRMNHPDMHHQPPVLPANFRQQPAPSYMPQQSGSMPGGMSQQLYPMQQQQQQGGMAPMAMPQPQGGGMPQQPGSLQQPGMMMPQQQGAMQQPQPGLMMPQQQGGMQQQPGLVMPQQQGMMPQQQGVMQQGGRPVVAGPMLQGSGPQQMTSPPR